MSDGVFDVAVIGGGVVGCAVARELAGYEISVVLLESKVDVGDGTSKANTAILHTGFDAQPGTLESRLVPRWLPTPVGLRGKHRDSGREHRCPPRGLDRGRAERAPRPSAEGGVERLRPVRADRCRVRVRPSSGARTGCPRGSHRSRRVDHLPLDDHAGLRHRRTGSRQRAPARTRGGGRHGRRVGHHTLDIAAKWCTAAGW